MARLESVSWIILSPSCSLITTRVPGIPALEAWSASYLENLTTRLNCTYCSNCPKITLSVRSLHTCMICPWFHSYSVSSFSVISWYTGLLLFTCSNGKSAMAYRKLILSLKCSCHSKHLSAYVCTDVSFSESDSCSLQWTRNPVHTPFAFTVSVHFFFFF